MAKNSVEIDWLRWKCGKKGDSIPNRQYKSISLSHTDNDIVRSRQMKKVNLLNVTHRLSVSTLDPIRLRMMHSNIQNSVFWIGALVWYWTPLVSADLSGVIEVCSAKLRLNAQQQRQTHWLTYWVKSVQRSEIDTEQKSEEAKEEKKNCCTDKTIEVDAIQMWNKSCPMEFRCR